VGWLCQRSSERESENWDIGFEVFHMFS